MKLEVSAGMLSFKTNSWSYNIPFRLKKGSSLKIIRSGTVVFLPVLDHRHCITNGSLFKFLDKFLIHGRITKFSKSVPAQQ